MIKRVLFLCLLSLQLFAYEYQVSIASLFNNEARFLKEWIEFHRLIGVEHFYLYNNSSSDNFQQVLDPYIKEGLVELFHWSPKLPGRHEFTTMQHNILRDAVRRTQGVSKWVAFIDTDEFIFPVKDKTLPKFLSRYEKYGAVAANWRIFGTSKIQKLNPKKLMIEQLTHRAPIKFNGNTFVKSIVQVNYVDLHRDFGVHTLPLLDGHITVNARGKRIIYPDCGDTERLEEIKIHHYALRDEEFLHNVKLKRPYTTDPQKVKEILTQAAKSNKIKDPSILVYAKALRRAMNK